MNYYPIYDEQLYDFNLTIFVLLPLANEYTIQPCFLTNKTKLCSSWHIANPLKMNEGFMNTFDRRRTLDSASDDVRLRHSSGICVA